ncbi:MAG: hypothetical protein HOI95_17145 [Chromatiales bacterium]|jgi:hypothetical protein|nr:hypothetical protein [Chromatiales bacterium]
MFGIARLRTYTSAALVELVLVVALMSAAPPAQASGGASSPDEAAAIVEARTGGQILGVRTQGRRYLVKVLTSNGRVRVVTVRAK